MSPLFFCVSSCAAYIQRLATASVEGRKGEHRAKDSKLMQGFGSIVPAADSLSQVSAFHSLSKWLDIQAICIQLLQCVAIKLQESH